MNGKTMVMLMLAVACGLGAMYGTTKLIPKGKNAPTVNMQDVLVAAQDFKVEEVIKANTVKVVRMPRTAVPAGAFTSAKDVEDRWVQIGILEGEPIIDRKLAARGLPPGLVARIPVGMRAFAIEVNEQTGVSGFVLPDHRVDVVEIETATNGKSEADTVLQDVLVLASGQVFTRPEDRSLQSRTVTLAVTPEQVDTLVSARSHGPLALSLRGLNDHVHAVGRKERDSKIKPIEVPKPADPPKEVVVVKAPEPPKEVVVVKAPEPPPAPPAPPAPRFVTIYRGVDNMRRVRLDQPPDLADGEVTAQAASTAATAAPQY